MRKGEVPAWKQKLVKELAEKIKSYSVIGVVDFGSLPSKQLLQIKHALRGTAEILMSRKRILKLALKEAGVTGLDEHLKGEPAMLFTNENPFKIANTLRKSRTFAPAKPGATMPKDIVIPAGETSFAPGPIVGELGIMGVKAAIESGKVVIKKDSVLAKEGEKIDKKKADLMAKMDIEPIEIGLDLQAAVEDNFVYQVDVLGITTEQLIDDMTNAALRCFKLSIGIGLPTAQNITFLVQKSWNGAKALAKEINYLCKATAGDVLAKSQAGMSELKKLVKVKEKLEAGSSKPEASSNEPQAEPEESKTSENAEPKTENPVPEVPKAEDEKTREPENAKTEPKEPEKPKPEEAPVEVAKAEEKPAAEKPEEPAETPKTE